MRNFLAIFPQQIVVLIKRSDTVVRPFPLTFRFGYRVFEGEKLKTYWSRHLESFNDALFVDSKDLIKNNPFDPFKRIIKLPDLRDQNVAYHIILSFETQFKKDFDKLVMFCLVEGFKESFIMIPSASAKAAETLIALGVIEKGKDE